ncbi:MAG: 3-isopropylmalate dehydratase small subunit [Proteobacteria bacterium]|nr:3-isopropylmalate dehydratase small subunit [Pseudomonadota bacterium]MDA1057357.1 3-isopropylmalate dehydratase small subunit [Pseudomonadota bacterium]
MEKFTTLTAVAAPMDRPNIDTDQLLPARFLRRPRAEGFGDVLFIDQRLKDDGTPNPDFVLNQPAYKDAHIIVADRNFGGGSSREGAPWALLDYGIRCVVASSFGDIFYNNSLKNGLLPVRLPEDVVKAIRDQLHDKPGATISVDLEKQTVIAPDGTSHAFDIESFRKTSLLKGLDDIGMTFEHEAEISAFEDGFGKRHPWLFART